MPRRVGIEVQCSRCDRIEFVPSSEEIVILTPGQAATTIIPCKPTLALLIQMKDGTNISFEDLCRPCINAIKTHLEAIGKKIEKLSPNRKKEA